MPTLFRDQDVPPCFIDIHILQSVPVSALNRDDLNAVKTVDYGGVRRTRVSSQAWKRAMREDFQKAVGSFAVRTRRLCDWTTRHLVEEYGWPEKLALKAGAHLVDATGVAYEVAQVKPEKGTKKEPVPNDLTTNGHLYLAEEAIEALIAHVLDKRDALENKAAKDIKSNSAKDNKATHTCLDAPLVQEIMREGNPVIQVFGRMLAEIDRAGVDGALQVAHAFTTHRTDLQVDYFTAVDDVTDKWEDETGSGHLGEAEFSAGTFYRFATLDLRELLKNMGKTYTDKEGRKVARSAVNAFIRSLPQAKKNSTAPHTIPDFVHLAVRSDRPLSFAAAFETPVRATAAGGHGVKSRETLIEYAQAATTMLGKDRIMASAWTDVRIGSYSEDQRKEITAVLGNCEADFDALADQVVEAAFAARENA